jgi:prepilin-type N-terminal cleavage/methylation domain-containing protein
MLKKSWLKFMDRTPLGFERGMTIIELMVALFIASVIGVGISRVFSANNYLFRGERRVSTEYVNTRLAMDEMTRAVRMINLNPQEVGGGVFGIQSLDSCTGATGALTQNPIPVNAVDCIYFTRDFDLNANGNTTENGVLDFDSNEIVGFYLNKSAGACPDANFTPVGSSCVNTVMVAAVNTANGQISGWRAKFQNVVLFQVDYLFANGKWASSGTSTQSPFFGQTTVPHPGFGTPLFNNYVAPPNGNTTGTGYGFGDVTAISIALTTRSEKPHDLTRQYVYEPVISTIRLRNTYYN